MAMERFMVVLAFCCVVMLMVINGAAAGTFKCPTAFWVFGDSLTDTGNAQVAFPTQAKLVAPYGQSYTFADKPGRNRYSDGRLVVDFVAQAFRFPFFGTYQHVLNGANYLKGANFAYSGATANATNFITPFYLNLQVDQFINFKNVTTNTSPFPRGLYTPTYLPPLINPFTQGAYYIPEIGGNDFAVATLILNLPSAAVIASFVPAAAAAVKQAITTLHATGGRLFFLGNTPPQGCNPAQLTILSSSPRDALGCADDANAVNRAYDVALKQVVSDLQANFSGDGTQIYYFDWYNATTEILTNPATYGFTNTNQTCCGAGGPYNYNSAFTCPTSFGSCCPGLTACATPQTYVSWDGIHYTEAFYKQTAKFFLNGRYVTPALNLTTECNLSFRDFS